MGENRISELLAARGVRLTRQRQRIFAILLRKRDHPTAADVYDRAKRQMPAISLATVYNGLEALVRSGLVKQVNLERAATRYCANLTDHNHFFCERCGTIHDIETPGVEPWRLPPGFVVSSAEVSLRGLCPDCSQ